jgi:hypothetical protein
MVSCQSVSTLFVGGFSINATGPAWNGSAECVSSFPDNFGLQFAREEEQVGPLIKVIKDGVIAIVWKNADCCGDISERISGAMLF